MLKDSFGYFHVSFCRRAAKMSVQSLGIVSCSRSEVIVLAIVGVTANLLTGLVEITAIIDLTSKLIALSSRRSCTTSESPSSGWPMSSGEFVA